MPEFVRKLCRNRKGGAAIEYGLMCALIVLAMIAALANLADITTNMWSDVSNKVEASN